MATTTKRKPTISKGSAKSAKVKEKAKKAQMPFHYQDYPEDHRWWENRASMIPTENRKPGRPPKFQNPEILQQACNEYFEWVDSHPLYEMKAFQYQGDVTEHPLPKKRPMTLTGLWLFLNFSDVDWLNYKKRDEEFFRVCTAAERVIYNQKFEGAAADLFNANIIARDLGLKDSHEVTGADDGPIQISDARKAMNKLSPEELDVMVEIMDKVMNKATEGENKE